MPTLKSSVQKNIEKGIDLLKRNSFINRLLYPIYNMFAIGQLRIYLLNRIYRAGALEALSKAKDALDSINAFFWLDFGTLLGAIREGDFIKHDLDVDIAMKLCDYSKDVDKAMIKAGFKKTFQFEISMGKKGLEQSYEYNGAKIDIFYYQFEKEKMWTYIFDGEGVSHDHLRPIAQYFPNNGFDRLIFKDMEFSIPKNPEKYLAFHYGDDFLIPNKNFNYKKDSLNTKYEKELEGVMTKY